MKLWVDSVIVIVVSSVDSMVIRCRNLVVWFSVWCILGWLFFSDLSCMLCMCWFLISVLVLVMKWFILVVCFGVVVIVRW